MIICGIGLGILVVSSPKSVLVGLKNDLIKAFKGGVANKGKFIDLLVLLYELFMLGRRKGTPALDEHVSDPQNSSIFTKYPSFLNDKGLVEFLCNSLRPIVDGRCKPAEIGGILTAELQSREAEANRSIKAVAMIADALPGVGIVAAVLGIINTMSNLEDPESVGQKVAAALSGTFLGIFLAYGVGVPITQLITLNQTQEFLYYHIVKVRFRLCHRFVSDHGCGNRSPISRQVDSAYGGRARGKMQGSRQGRLTTLFPVQVKSNHFKVLEAEKAVAHAGAWKVAYADFVTGMMSLFLVLWILSQDEEVIIATTRSFAILTRRCSQIHAVEQKDARPGAWSIKSWVARIRPCVTRTTRLPLT